jgi:hypothetical protein
VRRGTFSFVYPYAPGQAEPAGVIEVRIVADRPGPLRVTALAARGQASVLHLNLITVTAGREPAPGDRAWRSAVVQQARHLLAQAKIQLAVDAELSLTACPLARIAQVADQWETPRGEPARLARLGGERARNGSLNVYLVEDLPTGVEGLTLGLPGPVSPSSDYFGVIVRHTRAELAGKTMAHEVAHYLGLRHLRTVNPDGTVVLDPIDDTSPGHDNLMENGTRLTPGQIEVLRRSPLLREQ